MHPEWILQLNYKNITIESAEINADFYFMDIKLLPELSGNKQKWN